MIWVCSERKPGHVFQAPTENGLCPLCDPDAFSILKKSDAKIESGEKVMSPQDLYSKKIEQGDEYLAKDKPYDAWKTFSEAKDLGLGDGALEDKIQYANEKEKEAHQQAIYNSNAIPDELKELGLCIILMDASGSMETPAFEGSPITKMRLIAKAAASGIFSLRDNECSEYAYIAIYKFDHKIGPPILLKSIANIVREFRSESKFEDFLHDHLSSEDMGGQTNINEALNKAYDLARKFLNYEISAFREAFGGQDYPIKIQRIINQKTFKQDTASNVRVLLYTDGMQYFNDIDLPIDNPFKNQRLGNYDILMGAFIGPGSGVGSDGCKQLQVVLSQCPIHNKKQFFLIDHPYKIFTLRGLFRMASGNSGFCPECLSKSQAENLSNPIIKKKLRDRYSTDKMDVINDL